MRAKSIRVWDLPTRLFHWALAALIVALVISSGKLGGGWMAWHGRFGQGVLGLLVFRLVWGFLGSTYARFGQFFPTPRRIAMYARGDWHKPGHNPLGALSVLGLMGLVGFQTLSGLFVNDDIAFTGPLYALISKESSDVLTRWHRLMVNPLLVLIALHVVAIIFYLRVKRRNLIGPMLNGRHTGLPHDEARGGGPLAFALAMAIALGAAYTASGAWLPTLPPAQPLDLPDF